MSEYAAWFQCINGCPGQFSLLEIIYRCPNCGDLLEVRHDVEALRTPRGGGLDAALRRALPATPCARTAPASGARRNGSLPFIDDENIVSMDEGGTNLFWAERYGSEIGLDDLWVKQCGNSHTGSFKDLGMTVLVSVVKQMIADGQPIAAVACASTGDTSAALAAYCAAAGIPAIVILPRGKVSPAQLVQPLANGALVLSLDTDFDGCMAIVQQLTKQRTIYLANSMNSLRIEGQKTVGDRDRPAVRLGGARLGDHPRRQPRQRQRPRQGLPADARARADPKLPRIVVAQAENANPLYLAYLDRLRAASTPVTAQKTLASAIQIGNPVSVRNGDPAPCSASTASSSRRAKQELADAAARADRTGMFNCPHTGVALAVLRKLVEREMIQRARARRGDLHRPRPQVRRSEDRLPPRQRCRAYSSTPRQPPVEAERRSRNRSATPSRATSSESAAGELNWRPRISRPQRPTSRGLAGNRRTSARWRCTAASRAKAGNSLTTPIVQTATYTFADTAGAARSLRGSASSARSTAATAIRPSASPSKSSRPSKAPRTVSCSPAAWRRSPRPLFAMLSHRPHVVVTDDSYRRTRQFLTQTLQRYGIEVSVVPAGDYERIEEAIRPTTRLLVSESPTNPYNRIVDMERFAEIGRRHRVKTIDRLRPLPRRINQRPLEFGIDLVLHSATKYLGGHNDLLAGAVLGGAELVDGIRALQDVTGAIHRSLGGVPAGARSQDPRPAHRAAERQRAGAWPSFSTAIRRSPRCTTPACRAIPSTPSRARQMRGFGGVVSFEVKGDLDAALPSGRRLPHPAHRAVARRRREPDRAAGADELLRAQHRRAVAGGHQGQSDPLLGRHRGCRRPDRRPRARPSTRSERTTDHRISRIRPP